MPGTLNLTSTRIAGQLGVGKLNHQYLALICEPRGQEPDYINASVYLRPKGSRGLREGLLFRHQNGQAIVHIEKYLDADQYIQLTVQVSNMRNTSILVEYEGDPLVFSKSSDNTENEFRDLLDFSVSSAGVSIA